MALLNPAASCIITKEKPKDTAKSNESSPCIKATDVDNAITPAVWELGIPPVVVNILKLIFLCVHKYVITLINCAIEADKRPLAKASYPVL